MRQAYLKLSLVMVIMYCLALQAIAQDKLKVTERSGKTFRLKAQRIEDIYSYSGGKFWSISSSGDNYYVALYDENMNFVKGSYLKFKYAKKKLTFHSVVQFRGRYLIFLTFDNLKTDKKYLFYFEFEPDDLCVNPELFKVAEVKLADRYSTYSDFDIRVSQDKKYLLILGIPPARIKGVKKGFLASLISFPIDQERDPSIGINRFSYWLIDKEMEIINYEKKHRMNVEDENEDDHKFFIKDFVVDDDGTIYILGENTIYNEMTSEEDGSQIASIVGKKNRKKIGRARSWTDLDESQYMVEQISRNGTTSMFMTDRGVLYNDAKILLEKDSTVSLIALLAEQIYDYKITTGIARSRLNKKSLEVSSDVSENFSEEVLNTVNNIRETESKLTHRQKVRKEKAEKRRLSDYDMEMKEIAKRAALKCNSIAFCGLDENDNPVVVLEERYVTIVVTTTRDAQGNVTTTTTYYYSYDDLILAIFADDTLYQKGYEKSFTSINYQIKEPLAVSLKNGVITITAQNQVLRTDTELGEIQTYKLKGKSKSKKGKSNFTGNNFFTYRKTINPDLIVAANQRRFGRTTWYKIVVD
ncbi:MAG: hypothetical protein H6607_10825 [Flavobacteriales bacterium]|nr:hypothetical protein [Flavobacteriales bacterium]